MDTAATLALIEEAEGLLARIRQQLEAGDKGVLDGLNKKERARVLKVGPSAHEHLLVIEQKGQCTLDDSLEIRRRLGQDTQSTANHFGREGSGAILYRGVPYGTERQGNQIVGLNEAGFRMARLWREYKNLPLGAAEAG